jgi:hypothetical protein
MNLRNKTFVRTIQVLFGIYLLFFGLIGYFVQLEMPQYNEKAMAFLGALFNSRYLFPLMSIIFVLSGLMFIFNRWSAFGAILLAPVSVNILAFHVFLDTTNTWLALIPFVLNLYFLVIHWNRYRPMFSR